MPLFYGRLKVAESYRLNLHTDIRQAPSSIEITYEFSLMAVVKGENFTLTHSSCADSRRALPNLKITYEFPLRIGIMGENFIFAHSSCADSRRALPAVSEQ